MDPYGQTGFLEEVETELDSEERKEPGKEQALLIVIIVTFPLLRGDIPGGSSI